MKSENTEKGKAGYFDEYAYPNSENLPIELIEAENILKALTSVFLPTKQTTKSVIVDSIEMPKTEEVRFAEPPELVAKYQSLVEQIPAVVFMAFLEKGISEAYISPHIDAILGFSREEWLEDPVRWYRQIHPDDRGRWNLEATKLFLSGETLRSVYRVLARDGKIVWFQCEAKMKRHENGQPWFIHGVAFDITDLKQVEEELKKAREELELRVQERTAELVRTNAELESEIAERKRIEEERAMLFLRESEARREAEAASRLKDEFLATVSHELRTPLNAILGWTRLLRAGQIDEAGIAHALEVIERNAKSQNHVINDLLDVSRIISGKMTLNVSSLKLMSVIKDALDAVHLAANAKNIQLQILFDPDVKEINGDPDRLRQVVWNLLSNAIKFTPQGGHILVRLEREGSDAKIVVSDTGEGISSNVLPFIFDRFRQADGTTTRRYGGLGLGLSIVRHLVELHGGTVQAESDGKGQGATFIVRLPTKAILTEKDRSGSLQKETEDGKKDISSLILEGLSVLIVDDDTDTLEMFSTMLSLQGARVRTATSAAEALEKLDQWRPDILVADIGMPDEDGYEFIRKVRRQPHSKDTPALAVTAYSSIHDRNRALSAGYHMHLAKPIELLEFVEAVANLAGRATQ